VYTTAYVVLPLAERAALEHLALARDIAVDGLIAQAIAAWDAAGAPRGWMPPEADALYADDRFSAVVCRAVCWWLTQLPAGTLPTCAQLVHQAREAATAGDLAGMARAQAMLGRKWTDPHDPDRDEAGAALLEFVPEPAKSQVLELMCAGELARDATASPAPPSGAGSQ
jgi:hypothetical protein